LPEILYFVATRKDVEINNVTMQSEPLKWNREIENVEIVNGSKIGNIEMES
jgi:hypothetical protein